MAKLGQAQEPSMEEILASIRRIISDDDQKTTAPPPAPKLAVVETPRAELPVANPVAAPAPEPGRSAAETAAPKAQEPAKAEAPAPADADHDHEILELSEADADLPDDDLDASDITFAEPEPEPEPAFELPPPPRATVPPVPPVMSEATGDRRLLSQRTDEAVNTAFNQLASTFLTNQARSLEDIVKDMMRPMLKSWLDDNLPPLVERLVREEIERVSRGRR